MVKIGFKCTVKLYYKKERGQHYFRYELPAEKTGIRINSKGKEVPTYKKIFLRPDEYLPLSWYNSQRQWFVNPSTQAQKAWNKKTQSELDKLLMERQYLINNGTIPNEDKVGNRNKVDFFDFIDRWLSEKKYQDSTVAGYRSLVNRLKAFHNSSYLPFEIINNDFLRKFEYWLLNSEHFSSGAVCQNTANKRIGDVEFICYQAFNDKVIDRVEFTRRKKKKGEVKSKDFLKEEEIKKLLLTPMAHKPIKRWFLFSCFSGLAFKECQLLYWHQINDYNDHSVIKYTRSKTSKEYTLRINKTARKQLGERKNANEKVFPVLTKTNTLYKNLQKWVDDANINKQISPHCGRVTFAGLYYDKTKDPIMLMKVMGHKDFKTTMRYIKKFQDTSEQIMPEFEFSEI